MQYDKLIRDHIPEIIGASGKRAKVETYSEANFRHALLQKLVEEATEARDASPADLATEMADVLEVIDAVFATFGLSEPEVRALQTKRQAERGAFSKRLRLLQVEADQEPLTRFLLGTEALTSRY
jgi:predicted house-cleaning noncanonical NTP pyrophosphatase (MazG superfamily)